MTTPHSRLLKDGRYWKSKKSRGNDHVFGGDLTSSNARSGLNHKFSKPGKLFPTPTRGTRSNTMTASVHHAPSQSLKTLTPDAPYKLTLFTPSAPDPQAPADKWTVQTAHGSQYGASAHAGRDKDINIPFRHPTLIISPFSVARRHSIRLRSADTGKISRRRPCWIPELQPVPRSGHDTDRWR